MKNSHNKKNIKNKKAHKLFALPVILMLAVVPLIVICKVYDNSQLASQNWLITGSTEAEYFLYYRSYAIKLLGGLMAAIFLFRRSGDAFRGMKSLLVLIPTAVFVLSALLSALCSEYVDTGLWGGTSTFEGFFTLFAYGVVLLYVYAYGADRDWIRLLTRSLIIGSLIVSGLGVLQMFNIQYFTSSWFSPIVSLFTDGSATPGLSLPAGTAFCTMNNQDYVGSYTALVIPVMAGLLFYEKNIVFKILAGISLVFQCMVTKGADGEGGYIGIAVAVVLAVVFVILRYRKNRILLGGASAIFAVAVVAVAVWYIQGNSELFILNSEETAVISGIEGYEGGFEIDTTSGKTIVATLSYAPDICSFSLTDADGSELSHDGDLGSVITFPEEGYENVQLSTSTKTDTEGKTHIVLTVGDGTYGWDLTILDNGSVGILNFYNKLDEIHRVPTAVLSANSHFLNGRGSIWAKSIPMLADTVMVGVGSDEFLYAFPNDDYVGRINYGGVNLYNDRPHNMFLQIWIQDGMFACLALLFLYGFLFYWTIRNCFGAADSKLTPLRLLSLGLLCGITGYLAVGLVNDMVVSVAPVFWTLLGLAFAVNRLVEKEANMNCQRQKDVSR